MEEQDNPVLEESQEPIDPLSSILAEFSTRLNEIEEKQRLIKDRVLLVGENLISTREEFLSEELQTRKKLKQMEYDIKSLKQLVSRVINEMSNFSRKSELEILERQMKMFQPLEFARIKDVKQIVQEEIKEKKSK